MPLYTSDYKWEQTPTSVTLSLDLKSGSRDVDVVYASHYVKINFRPYICEIFLKHSIVPTESKNTVEGSNLEIKLSKQMKEHWDVLAKTISKKEAKMLRKIALEEIEKLEKSKTQTRKETRIALNRLSISKQIELNEENFQLQKKKLVEEKENFFKKGANEIGRDRISSTCSDDSGRSPCEKGYDGDGEDSMYYSSTENIKTKVDNSSTVRKVKKKESKSGEEKINSEETKLPDVRNNKVFKIRFTPRKLQTPKRESTADEDQKIEACIIEKENKVLKQGDPSNNLTFYKTKAANLFKTGDYEGSTTAYTCAINLSPLEPSLYSNRATSNLMLEMFDEVVSDCTHTLRLLQPGTSVNAHSRVLALVRRGTAYLNMFKYTVAYEDYKKALHLQPMNKDLARDAERVRGLMLESSSDNILDSSEDESNETEEDEDDT